MIVKDLDLKGKMVIAIDESEQIVDGCPKISIERGTKLYVQFVNEEDNSFSLVDENDKEYGWYFADDFELCENDKVMSDDLNIFYLEKIKYITQLRQGIKLKYTKPYRATKHLYSFSQFKLGCLFTIQYIEDRWVYIDSDDKYDKNDKCKYIIGLYFDIIAEYFKIYVEDVKNDKSNKITLEKLKEGVKVKYLNDDYDASYCDLNHDINHLKIGNDGSINLYDSEHRLYCDFNTQLIIDNFEMVEEVDKKSTKEDSMLGQKSILGKFLVWREGSDLNLCKRLHPTYESASKECERLAKLVPNRRFHILQPINSCISNEVTWEKNT